MKTANKKHIPLSKIVGETSKDIYHDLIRPTGKFLRDTIQTAVYMNALYYVLPTAARVEYKPKNFKQNYPVQAAEDIGAMIGFGCLLTQAYLYYEGVKAHGPVVLTPLLLGNLASAIYEKGRTTKKRLEEGL